MPQGRRHKRWLSAELATKSKMLIDKIEFNRHPFIKFNVSHHRKNSH